MGLQVLSLAPQIALLNPVSVASPGDFVLLNNELNFTEAIRTDCVMLSIVDDAVVEPLERFSIVLTPPAGDQFQLGIPGSATVNITDNDGKCSDVQNASNQHPQ